MGIDGKGAGAERQVFGDGVRGNGRQDIDHIAVGIMDEAIHILDALIVGGNIHRGDVVATGDS